MKFDRSAAASLVLYTSSLLLSVDYNHALATPATIPTAPTSVNTAPNGDVGTTSTVVPPMDPSDVSFDTLGVYESSVQQTYGRYPLTITRGAGCKLYSSDDTEYLDFVAGISTCALGHGNPLLSEAIAQQMTELHHVSNLYFIPQQAALAKWLCDNSVADKAFFCNSGAEANEGAIKLARKHASQRGITDPVIITAHNSFHGRTLATVTATAQPKYHVGFGYGGKMVQGFEYTEYNDAEALEKLVKKMNKTPLHLKLRGRKRGVAAIMMEALQGEGGIMAGTKEFFGTARSLCDETGALLMCDEVQAGMGRTGKMWGYENLDVVPDVFTSAKALGGGVPIGAMMARGDAASILQPGDHASTYGGNPLACTSGLTVAKYLSQSNVLDNVTARGDQLKAGLEEMAKKYPTVLGEVRGWGLLRGVVVKDDAGCTAGEIVGDAMQEGLLLVPAGTTVVRFVPPLIVTEEEIDSALTMFEKAVKKRVTQ